MFEFVIVEDDINYQARVKTIINEICLKRNVDYKIEKFSTITPELLKIVDLIKPKIYILDLELANGKSGIELARLIRIKDLKSIVIVLTSHEKLTMNVLRSKIMALDFISKFDECNKNLKESLNKAILYVNDNKIIVYKSYKQIYRVFPNDIIYIEKDSYKKRTIIKTIYREISVKDTISNIKKDLPDNFYQSHRSCIVNLDRITSFDKGKNILEFENNMETDLVSRNYKKGIINYVNGD